MRRLVACLLVITTLNSGGNGIAGFMRHSGATMQHWDVNAIADFQSLHRTAEGFHWVENGVMQGTAGRGCPGSSQCIRSGSATAQRRFTENWRADGTYSIVQFGAPPTPNHGYYIHWNGSCQSYGCTFYFKFGTVNKLPDDIGYLAGSWGIPQVAYESFWNTDIGIREPLGNDYFGVNDNFQPDQAYGFRFYDRAANLWYLWTAARYPATTCLNWSPLEYVAINVWWAFRVHDDSHTAACP
jgi:hypothetical protein